MAITEYTWNPLTDSVIEETDGAGNVLVEYVNEPSAYGPLLSQHKPGEDRYFHFDAIGSTRVLTDKNGYVTDTYTYDAWGNEAKQFGWTSPSYLWNGRLGYESDLLFLSVRHRLFSASNANWHSVDPIPLTSVFEAYKYALNNPIGNTDPSGLTPQCIAIGSVAPSGTQAVLDPNFTNTTMNDDPYDVSWRRIVETYEYFLDGGWYGGSGNTIFNPWWAPPEPPTSTWKILVWAEAGGKKTTTVVRWAGGPIITETWDTRQIQKRGGAICSWSHRNCRCEVDASAEGGSDNNWTTSRWLFYKYEYGVSAFIEATVSGDRQVATFNLGFASQYGGTVRYSGSYYLDFDYSSSVRKSISNKTTATVTCEQRGEA